MKTSAVFKLAKGLLAETYADTCTHKEKFICIAIRTAGGTTKRITEADIKRCEDVIESRLDHQYTLEGWLAARKCIRTDYTMLSRETLDRIQQHRHAWLDMLIAEFEAQGD